jgi:tRNA modification GTPase
LGEDRAIVSNIAGTTRDVIEETLNIDGILFRLIDTAGIRETTETIEALGIERSRQKIKQATIVLCMADATVETSTAEVRAWKSQLENQFPEKKIEFILNKVDAISEVPAEGLAVSAKNGNGIEALKKHLVDLVIGTFDLQNDIIVANARHHEALQKTALALEQALQGLENGTTGDFVAMDIREAMRQLGNITGQIDIDTDIFGRFFRGFISGSNNLPLIQDSFKSI